jgi:hypothetical protein
MNFFFRQAVRIPDPGSKKATKKRGEKNVLLYGTFFCSHKFRIHIILFLKCQRKKFGPIFKELLKF